jgi:sigma-B regulation protein RsbU (phosphoserine phosphatase)
MFYGVIDTIQDKLFFASASAPAPIVFRKGGYDMLDSAGMLLGAWKNAVYETQEVSFNQGDCLLLYSDALIETPDAAGNMMAIENAAEIFAAKLAGDVSCATSFDSLLSHFNECYSSRLNDDLTLVAFCRR